MLEEIQAYLETRFDDTVEIEAVQQLGSELSGDDALKQFGYGNPVLVRLNFNETTWIGLPQDKKE